MALRQDGGAVMNSNGDDKKQNSTGKTDFSKFRLPTNSPGMPVAQKVLIHVPVGKPGKQKFVRSASRRALPFRMRSSKGRRR
jgi:hypothetical protein